MSSKKNSSSEDKSYRSAVTGRYVTPRYAKSHPNQTVGEKRKK